MWDRLWVIAHIELNLTDEEWFDLSYRQFSLLHERWLTLRWQNQWQLGSIAAAVYQCGMRNFDPMPKRDDFIFTIPPGQKPRKSAATKRKRMTKARAVEIFDVFRKAAEGFEIMGR